MEPLQWIFVTAAITLVFVVYALNPIQGAIDEAIANNARLQARMLASSINLIADAPDGTAYSMPFPSSKCHILITPHAVEVTTQNDPQIYGLEATATISHNYEFDCGPGSVQITKQNGVLNFESA